MTNIKTIPYEDLCAAAEILKMLSHADRLAICQLLLHREHSVGELSEQLELKQNVVSQHLAHLRARSIVRHRRNGKTVYYALAHPAPGWLLSCIGAHLRRVDGP